MTTYYLQVQGVNLSNFIFDTADLSTIRGGSLLLLDSIDSIPKRITSAKLEPITTGASAGLFTFETPEDQGETAKQVRNEVELALNDDPGTLHATFAVDVVPASNNFTEDREKILTLNRYRQMRQPRLAIPQWNEDGKVSNCNIDGIKPGVAGVAGVTKRVSISVKVRREYGLKQKRGDFYKKYSGMEPNKEFSRDFDELTNDPSRGNLHHKMALIYLDGNKFGSLQAQTCKDAPALNDFDTTVKEYRKGFLQRLISRIETEQGWPSTEGRYRLETLLWGGDEMILVVPAWKGWDLLSLFYQCSRDWQFRNHRLTHAGGIVFCHHNAPIYRITNLTHELAERAKKKSNAENCFAYQVLESFDHIGADLDRWREMQHADGETLDDLILPGDTMSEAAEAFLQFKNDDTLCFPRRKLFEVVKLLRKDSEKAGNIIEKLMSLVPDTLLNYFGNNRTSWFHIAELWDYVGD